MVPPLSRRTLGSRVAGLAVSAALVTAGCDTDEPLDLPGLPPIGEEPDRDRVLTGLRDEQAVLEQVSRVRRRHRRLRRALAPTAAVHQAHVELLSRAVDDSDDASEAGPDSPVPGDPAKAVAQLVRLERSLAERHVATAVKSRSGVLARVVAAMSAAAAQQAVVLAPLAVPEQEPDG
jgi:hypothetical protein